jgi:hypothetical protein
VAGCGVRGDDELRGAAAALLDLALLWQMDADPQVAAVARELGRMTSAGDGPAWWQQHRATLPRSPYMRKPRPTAATNMHVRTAALVRSLAEAARRASPDAPFGPPVAQVSVQLPVSLASAMDELARSSRRTKRALLEGWLAALPRDPEAVEQLARVASALLDPALPCRHVSIRVGGPARGALDALHRSCPDGRSLRHLVIIAVALGSQDP